MKILSWNIAGCQKFSKKINDALSYDGEDFNYFTNAILSAEADLICLQEVLKPFDPAKKSQTEEITKKIGLEYSADQIYGKSHLKKDNNFSLGNISRFKIMKSYFVKLTNPGLTVERENGDKWATFDVGFLVSEIKWKGVTINLANSHLTPYHYFKRNFIEKHIFIT